MQIIIAMVLHSLFLFLIGGFLLFDVIDMKCYIMYIIGILQGMLYLFAIKKWSYK